MTNVIKRGPDIESRVRVMARPDDMSPEQWNARVQVAHLTLVRVLLRTRERLIADGKLTPEIVD